MSVNMFLGLLAGFTALTTAIVEVIKKVAKDKKNLSYNLTAIITGVIVGTAGTLVYYQLNSIPFEVNNIIIAILMGFASSLSSMLTFDKVAQLIKQLSNPAVIAIVESAVEEEKEEDKKKEKKKNINDITKE